MTAAHHRAIVKKIAAVTVYAAPAIHTFLAPDPGFGHIATKHNPQPGQGHDGTQGIPEEARQGSHLRSPRGPDSCRT